MFLSTNNGNSWIAVNSGLTNTVITSFLVSGGTIYAGTDGGGVWRRPISEMVGIINDKQQTLSPISTDFNLATSAQSNHNIAISFFSLTISAGRSQYLQRLRSGSCQVGQ